MPKKLENKLKREAQKHGFKKSSKKYNAYVYGTLNKVEKKKK